MRGMMYAAAAATLALTAGAANAQMPAMSGTESPAAYVKAAGQSDQFEIQEGKLASTMGATPKVRAFGKQMIADHTKSTRMVMGAAMASGLPQMPPPPLRPDQEQMIAQLQGTSGRAFDRMYVQQQMQSHQQALQLQKAYSTSGTDANLRGAATKIVPVVEHHISELESLQSGMGAM